MPSGGVTLSAPNRQERVMPNVLLDAGFHSALEQLRILAGELERSYPRRGGVAARGHG
jgi:hypothetical protein